MVFRIVHKDVMKTMDWFYCLVLCFMIIRSAKSMRVAVLGSGISGSAAARTLADRGIEVTVFEVGYGIGGRTSTRITRDEHCYQFDHGCQFISGPKTPAFRDALEAWKRDDWVRPWTGTFVREESEGMIKDQEKERYVGYPTMNSICQHLLQHERIKVVTQTRANASAEATTGQWKLIQDKTQKALGSFDWLVASDRLSAAHYRKDLPTEIKQFQQSVQKVKSVKSLTAMVVLDGPLDIPLDGAQFATGRFGSLGWIARDSSKPGRGRKDNKECWVLQSNPEAASQILASMKGRQSVHKIRERARDVLVNDFLAAIPSLSEETVHIPPVTEAIGHRWGGAFPISTEELQATDSSLDADHRFVSCGDYYGALTGRVEGAYLSGMAAANKLLSQIDKS